MTTFTWSISNLERKLPDGDVPPDGLVYNIHWHLTATEEGQTVTAYGSVALGEPDPDDYTPFDEITEEQAIEWAQAALGDETVASLEASLEAQLQEKLHPKTKTGVPW